MPPILYNLIPALLGLAGLVLSICIYHWKKSKKPITCPINGECTDVMTSRHSTFLGVDNEKWGILYYSVILLSYLLLVISPTIASTTIYLLLLTITFAASIYSLYLTAIQGVVLSKWCFWCLVSAAFSLTIFIFAYLGESLAIKKILVEFTDIITYTHNLALSIGLGLVIATTILFHRFLGDLKITKTEANNIHIFSQILWASALVILITTIGLYAPNLSYITDYNLFILEITSLFFVIATGLILSLFIYPKLEKIREIKRGDVLKDIKDFLFLRQSALSLGIISIISWFILYYTNHIEVSGYSFRDLVIFYCGLVVVGVIIVDIYEHHFFHRDKLLSLHKRTQKKTKKAKSK